MLELCVEEEHSGGRRSLFLSQPIMDAADHLARTAPRILTTGHMQRKRISCDHSVVRVRYKSNVNHPITPGILAHYWSLTSAVSLTANRADTNVALFTDVCTNSQWYNYTNSVSCVMKV